MVEARAGEGALAIVHEWLSARAGSEKVFEAMAEAFPSADLYALTRQPGLLLDLAGRRVTTTFLDRRRLRARRALTLPLMPLAWRGIVIARAYDTVLTSSHAFARAFPPARAASTTHYCYCHAPMRYAWTPQLDARTRRWTRSTAAVRLPLRAWDRRTAASVDHFAANSTDVRERIRRFYGRDARVIFPPVDTRFYTPAPVEPERTYVLAVSRFVRYKRLDLAIAAAARVGVPLIVAGSGPEEARLRRLATAEGGAVTFVIAPDDAALRELYRHAAALVFPAIEDFGIVAVEAQACGTPVVAMNAGGARDTVSEGRTGVRVSAQDVALFASALRDLLRRGVDAAACRAHAERFSHERFVAELRRWIARRD
jgi:glycosyltransferase involved in cell wall biosynthesis